MAFHKLQYIFVFLILISCSKPKETLPINEPSNLTYFSFLKDQNTSLPQDIYAQIKGDSIIATTFLGTNINSLIPTFEFEGNEVSSDNKLQSSGKSSQNFSQIKSYSVKEKNGNFKNYFVKIKFTNLPVLYLDTDNRPILSKETYVAGNFKIFQKAGNETAYNGLLQIRGRGNSTWGFPKKPYKIKLGKKAGLLGMNEAKDYVLLANYADKSLLRNEVGFEISRILKLDYTPASQMVDIVLNGEYLGNYQLVEQLEVGKNKINLFDNKPEDENKTDAFFAEVDGFNIYEKINFKTNLQMPISVHYPDDEMITNTQKQNIINGIQKFETALVSNIPENEEGNYRNFFDLDSYVNFYLANEIAGNPDLFWSTYLYKKEGENLIYSGPVWDLDIAFSNDRRIGNTENRLMLSVGFEPKMWINRLMQDKTFKSKVRTRWNEIKAGKLIQIPDYIDKMVQMIDASQQKNFQKWTILNQNVYNNYQALGSFEAEVTFLKNYYKNRLIWLDTQFNSTRFD